MTITINAFRKKVDKLGTSQGLDDAALKARTAALNALTEQLPRNAWGLAYLEGANLSGLDLRGAGLWGAVLCSANLSDANLTDANLCGANLADADLTGADFTGADLTGTRGIRT